MNPELLFKPEWISADNESEELRKTSASLFISCAEKIGTQAWDEWSTSIQDSVRLSAYPLAMWFASCWWRLRWEPAMEGVRPIEWRMAHEMRAVGYGFLWPPMTFEPDGEDMEITCRPRDDSNEPVRYLSRFSRSISGESYERAVDTFVEAVIARIDAVGVQTRELHDLWAIIRDERMDAEIAASRRLEARLGFYPEEAPLPLVNRLREFADTVGMCAIDEIAPVCAGDDPENTFQQIVEMANAPLVEGRVELPREESLLLRAAVGRKPWEKGYALAHEVRAALGAGDGPIGDDCLANIFHMDEQALAHVQHPGRSPLGLAVRQERTDRIKVGFHSKFHVGRRFEFARLLADYIMAPADRWLPATKFKTARQKIQRAFAVEFLCPLQSLLDFLSDDFSSEMCGEAAEHFSVSPLAVKTMLVNNGTIPPEAIYG